jgi:hypothetical protein
LRKLSAGLSAILSTDQAMVNKAKTLYLKSISIKQEAPPECFGNPLKMNTEGIQRKNSFMTFLDETEDVDKLWIKYEREMLIKPKFKEDKKKRSHTYVELT